MFEKFTEHPHSKGMTYVEHFEHAMGVGIECYKLCWALLIHAVFPFWYKEYASQKLKELTENV
tara:strand:+ start:1045 stop:1233 length:189 start_codon:yes stop_codon:yes gene_type:complete